MNPDIKEDWKSTNKFDEVLPEAVRCRLNAKWFSPIEKCLYFGLQCTEHTLVTEEGSVTYLFEDGSKLEYNYVTGEINDGL